MIQLIRSYLTFGNVIATAALFIALGGTAVAVTNLPRNSVGTAQLRPGAVQNQNIAREAVGRNKIRRGAVNNVKIAAGAVNAPKIANGAVNRFKITPGAVDASRLSAGAVGPGAIQNGAVGPGALTPGAVGTDNLANGSVTRAKVNENSLPMLSTLRTGQTLRGMFALGGEGTRFVDAQTFEFPMLGAPLAPPANIIDVAGGAPVYTPQCPGIAGGNQQTPNAAAGQLCFYITHKEGDPTLEVTTGALTRLGFGLTAAFPAAGNNLVVGQWATTAG